MVRALLVVLLAAPLAEPVRADEPSPLEIVHLLPVPSSGGYWTAEPEEIRPIGTGAGQRRVMVDVDRGIISVVDWETEDAARNVPSGRPVELTDSLLAKLGTRRAPLDPVQTVATEPEGTEVLAEVVDGAGFARGSWRSVVVC